VPPDDAGCPDPLEQRFRDLYQRHYRLIRAYALRRTCSAEDAADVVSDTFTITWRRIRDVPAPPADRLWLYGVARRVIGGRQRSAGRHRNLLARLVSSHPAGDTPGPVADPAPADPATAAVRAALGRLGPLDREALQLVVWDGLSHLEAAEVLGCSPNAVGIRIHRAKARLRADLSSTSPAGPAPLANYSNG
jgi:RNA polymerase sigma-70 factor (ECF subfamily)